MQGEAMEPDDDKQDAQEEDIIAIPEQEDIIISAFIEQH